MPPADVPNRRPIPLADVAHDRAAQRRADDRWMAEAWQDPATLVVAVSEAAAELEPSGRLAWRRTVDAPVGERYFLGVDGDEVARFAVRVADPGDMAWCGLRELASRLPPEEAAWACHAAALAQWHATHGHCPRCGSPTEPVLGGAERRCPDDGSAHFPRVDPAVIVLVTDEDDRVLLGRQGSWPPGRYSTLAGFVEPGESAEHAVRREILEESGVLVDGVELLATQPWPFPSSLMIGAAARTSGRPEPRPDGVELAEVRWWGRDELAAAVADGSVMVPGPVSISRWLIDRWFGAELPDDGAGWR